MPPLKELHYFDRSPIYPSPSHLACRRWKTGLFGSGTEDKHWRSELARGTAEIARRSDVSRKVFSDLRWFGRYMFGFPKDDDWYRGLFAAGATQFKGEITPAYSLLDEPTIAHIADAFPGIRILFIIRNPIDRALSVMAFNKRHGYLPRTMSHSDMIGFLGRPAVVQRGKYLEILGRWQAYFGPDQFKVFWYDDIRRNPGAALNQILAFLSLAPTVAGGGAGPGKQINASHGEFPDEVVTALCRMMHGDLVELSAAFGGHADKWLAQCEARLAGCAAVDNREDSNQADTHTRASCHTPPHSPETAIDKKS